MHGGGRWVDIALAIAVAVAAWTFYRTWDFSTVTDSNYALLLSETLLHERTFALDRHIWPPLDRERWPGVGFDDPKYQAAPGYPYQIEVLLRDPGQPDRPRVYLYYPNFTSILAIPAVVLLNLKGLHATAADGGYDPRGETQMQSWIAAVIVAASVALVYVLARTWLSAGWSLAIALTFAAASPLWSTASRAMWTSTWGIVIGLGLLWHLARVADGKAQLRPAWVGTLCAFLYFCRPALAIEVLSVAVWVLACDWRGALRMGVAGAAWAAAFAVWSWSISGQWLPSYYRQDLQLDHFAEGLYGSLVSPGRGLLVYTPFLLPALVALGRHWRMWPTRGLVTMALLGTFGHAVMLACYANWWGGHSYGARLMIDTLPLTVVWTSAGLATALGARPAWPPAARTAGWLATAALVTLGVWIHWRGVTDQRTWLWNSRPVDINEDHRRALDWRLPQFLVGLVPQPPPDAMPVLGRSTSIEVGEPAAQPPLLHDSPVEARTSKFVMTMYIGMFDRIVDSKALADLAGMFDAAYAGGGIEGVRAQARSFGRLALASAEYQSKNPTNQTQVVRFYRAYLGRFPNTGEIAYWQGELDAGRQTADTLIDFFAASAEFTDRLNTYFGSR